jgi:hypothetical protein
MKKVTVRKFTEMFFIKRFGKSYYKDNGYFNEWVERFKKDSMPPAADYQSMAVIYTLRKRYYY